MTTYDHTEAEDRSGPLIRLLYFNAVVWAALGVSAAVALLGDDSGAWIGVRRGFLGVFLLLLVTGVLWLRWFKVIALRTERTGRARFRGAWWFWAWVIPVVYLVLPKMMINDAWHAPDPPSRPEPVPAVIQWWWGLWVATGAGGYLLRPLLPLLGELFFGLFIVSQVAQALLASQVVRALTDRNALLGPRPAPHPEYIAPSWPATTP